MNVAIKPDSQPFVEAQMKAGRFTSPEDVVQAGLELLQEQQQRLTNIRAQIALGLEQARRGEFSDGDVVLDEIFGRTDRAGDGR